MNLDDFDTPPLTMAEVAELRVGKPISKPLPHAFAKEDRRKAKVAQGETFRRAVWERDRGRSRASGKPLARSGTDYHKVGEVHHVIARSLAPDRIYEVGNGILLSKHEHLLAETTCPNAPELHLLDIEGAEDRGDPQRFIWRDVHGTQLRWRIG